MMKRNTKPLGESETETPMSCEFDGPSGELMLAIVEASQKPAFIQEQRNMHRRCSVNRVEESNGSDDEQFCSKQGNVTFFSASKEEQRVEIVCKGQLPSKKEQPHAVEFCQSNENDPQQGCSNDRPERSSVASSNSRSRSMPGAHSVQGMSSSNLNVQEDPQAQVNHPFGTSITTSNTANAVPDQMHLVEAQLVPDAEEDKDQQDPGNVLQAKPVKTLTCCGKLIQANLILLAVILLLCIALVVALSVALSAHKKAPASTPLTTPVTTNTTAGPMEDHELSRFELFRSVLSPLVTANGDLFESPETPQYKALHWLANEDAANLSIVEHGNRRITQRYVLAVLYFSTNGPHWEHSYNFLSPDHECDWKAKDYKENDRGVVECNVLWGTVVTNIQLYWNNLTGTIPDEIGALSSLQYLGLNINNLHGEIPKTLPVSLNQLFINDNNFTGTMPVEVASLKNLDALSIYNNPGLTGSLDFLCQERTIRWFPADCGGSSPAVDCPCCSNCCDAEASLCCDVGSNSTDSCWDPTPVKDTSDVFDDDVF